MLLLALVTACSSAEPDPGPVSARDGGQAVRDGGVVTRDAGPRDGGIVDRAPRLFDMLRGRFDSADQAQRDPEYFDVSLIACTVEAPELGELVLYIEQALSNRIDAPYRQRLYVVERIDDESARSRVFTLANEAAMVGACDRAAPTTLAAADATERDGCAVDLAWVDGDHFEGGTVGESCASSLNGATYATSEVELYDDRVESWDRGYDGAGSQVWGATGGPYIFVRRD